MSNWNAQEVASLDEKNGGGNRAATKQWLANAPESVRPSPDSHVDAKKTFVDKAYNKKEFESTGPVTPVATSQPSTSPSKPAPAKPERGRAPRAAPARETEAAKSVPATTVNLLDDDAFSSPTVSAPPQAPAKAATPASAIDLLDDGFFNPQPAPQSTGPVASDVTSTPGGYGGSAFSFVSANAAPSVSANAAPSGSAFSFVSPGSQPFGEVSFDPLAAPSAPTPAPQLQSPAPASFNFVNQQQQPPASFNFVNQQQQAAPAPVSFNTGTCAQQASANQKQPAFQASSFDPFDPFAPDPASVRG